jgi:predicted ATPase
VDAYRDCGYETIELPRLAVSARARFILAQLQAFAKTT